MATDLQLIRPAGPPRPPALLIHDLPGGSPWRLAYHPQGGYTVGIQDDDGRLIDGGSHADPQQAIDEAVKAYWWNVVACPATILPRLDAVPTLPAKTPLHLQRVWESTLFLATIALLWLTVGRWLR